MCLAIPAKIDKILDNHRAIASVGGVAREISTCLLEQVNLGDYVILHVGYALTKLNETEAQKTLELFAEMLAENHP